jgi:hypothetical protein
MKKGSGARSEPFPSHPALRPLRLCGGNPDHSVQQNLRVPRRFLNLVVQRPEEEGLGAWCGHLVVIPLPGVIEKLRAREGEVHRPESAREEEPVLLAKIRALLPPAPSVSVSSVLSVVNPFRFAFAALANVHRGPQADVAGG